MGKKIVFPDELRGAKLGRGWYEDNVRDDLEEIASNMLKDKLDEIWRITKERRS